MDTVALLEIAERLYGLAPSEFIAERDRAALAAKGSELAPAIKALRKPSVSAGLINELVRREPAEIDQLIELGAALREAQAAHDGEQLRALSLRRRELVSQLRAKAGRGATDAVGRELESTLEAAVVDPTAAGALRSGRLIRALSATGLDPVELPGSVALPDQLPEVRRVQLKSVPALRRPTAIAERALRRAESALTVSTAKLAHAQAQLEDAAKGLDAARQALANAEREHETALRERESARRTARRADSS